MYNTKRLKWINLVDVYEGKGIVINVVIIINFCFKTIKRNRNALGFSLLSNVIIQYYKATKQKQSTNILTIDKVQLVKELKLI